MKLFWIAIICLITAATAVAEPDGLSPKQISAGLDRLEQTLKAQEQQADQLAGETASTLEAFSQLYIQTRKLHKDLAWLREQIAALGEQLPPFSIRVTQKTYAGPPVTVPLHNGDIVAFTADVKAPAPFEETHLTWQFYGPNGKAISGITKTEEGPSDNSEQKTKQTRIRFMLNDLPQGRYTMALTYGSKDRPDIKHTEKARFDIGNLVLTENPKEPSIQSSQPTIENSKAGSKTTRTAPPNGAPTISDMVIFSFIQNGLGSSLSPREEASLTQRMKGVVIPKEINRLIASLLDLRQKKDAAQTQLAPLKAAYEAKNAEMKRIKAQADALYNRHQSSGLTQEEKTRFYQLQDQLKVLWPEVKTRHEAASKNFDVFSHYLMAIKELTLLLGKGDIQGAEAYERKLERPQKNLAAVPGRQETVSPVPAAPKAKSEQKKYYALVYAHLDMHPDPKALKKPSRHKITCTVTNEMDYQYLKEEGRMGPQKRRGICDGTIALYRHAFGPQTKERVEAFTRNFNRSPLQHLPPGLQISRVTDPKFHQPDCHEFTSLPDQYESALPYGY